MSKIAGLDSKQFSELKNLLSYDLDPAAKFFSGRSHRGRISLLDNKGVFPTGLLYIVKECLKTYTAAVRIVDNRINPRYLKQGVSYPKSDFVASLVLPPRPEQLDAARAVLERFRGIICMPTGTGKSLVIALIINDLKLRTLIVVPTLELKRQLTVSLKAIFKSSDVGGLGCDIAVENVDALDPNKPVDYDILVIDEFHHSAAKTYRRLNRKAWPGIFYRVGLTATPFRTQDNERLLLESVLSEVTYKLDYDTAVKKKYIVPIEAYYVDLPKRQVEGFTWAQVYSELVVNNEHRNYIISNLIKTLQITKKSTICLVKEIMHGQIIAKLAGHYTVPFLYGDNEENSRFLSLFNDESTMCIVGTRGVLGEGIDTKPAEYIIIAGLGKSKGAFMQQCGRGMRVYGDKESCKVILFRDSSHKFTLSHFNQQVKHLREEYGTKPVKLDIGSF